MNDRKLIIWGKDNYNVLGLLRQLKDYKGRVTLLLVGKRHYCATISRYCHDFLFVKDIKEGYDFLISNYNNEKYKPVIIPTNDLVAEYIDSYQDRLRGKYLFSYTLGKSLSDSLDKMKMHDLALSCGINTPRSYYLSDDEQAKKVGFPCVIKPVKKYNGIPTKFKIKICVDKDQLQDVVSSVEDAHNYMIQEYVNKEYELLIYGCRNKSGDVLIPCILRKERWYEGDGSYGKILATIPSCIDTNAIKKFLDQTGYYGLFSFEYGVSEGEAFYYETNFRNDGTSHLFYQAGINIPIYWIRDLCDENNDISSLEAKKELTFIDEVYDINNVWIGIIEKREWLKEKKKASVYKYYDSKDRVPYCYQILFRIAYRIYCIFKR